jgi:hypothetical protein
MTMDQPRPGSKRERHGGLKKSVREVIERELGSDWTSETLGSSHVRITLSNGISVTVPYSPSNNWHGRKKMTALLRKAKQGVAPSRWSTPR